MKKLLILMILFPLVCLGQTRPHWLQIDGKPFADVRTFGAKGDGVTDDTAAIQAAIDSLTTGGTVIIPAGLYIVKPSTPIILDSGISIVGENKYTSQLVAYPEGGTLIKREFDISGPNSYVAGVKIKDLGIILRHPTTAALGLYEQIAIDFNHITRSVIEDVYIGNYGVGASSHLTPPTNQNSSRQGYGIVLGTTSGSHPAYAGGEANTINRVFISGVRWGIMIDDPRFFLPSASSAAYATKILNSEITATELAIAQLSQFGAGMTFRDNIIQAVDNMTGSASETAAITIRGYNNTVIGGYMENPHADYAIRLGALSKGNRIYPYMESATSTVEDLGTNNIIERTERSGDWSLSVNKQELSKALPRAYAVFTYNATDSEVVVWDSFNVGAITRIATGQYTLAFPAGVFNTASYSANLSADSQSPSVDPVIIYGRGVTGERTPVLYRVVLSQIGSPTQTIDPTKAPISVTLFGGQ